jgi:hypothetical protein
MRSPLFRDVTQLRFLVTNASEQPIGSIFEGPTVPFVRKVCFKIYKFDSDFKQNSSCTKATGRQIHRQLLVQNAIPNLTGINAVVSYCKNGIGNPSLLRIYLLSCEQRTEKAEQSSARSVTDHLLQAPDNMTAAFAKQNSGIVCQTLNTMATWKI